MHFWQNLPDIGYRCKKYFVKTFWKLMGGWSTQSVTNVKLFKGFFYLGSIPLPHCVKKQVLNLISGQVNDKAM